MTRHRFLFCALVVVGACGDDPHASLPTPDDPTATLSRVDREPAGVHCRDGGAVVRTGLDDDRDGGLDDDEIDRTDYLCDGPPARQMIRRDDEPAGAHCEFGGIALRAGLDENRDGTLVDGEVEQTDYVCNARPAEALVRRDDEPAGSRCPQGGAAIRTGIDRNGDHRLDDDEIDDTTYTCNAAEGRALVRRSDEPAGGHCTSGGVAVSTGVDRDRDGALADDEIQDTTYACNAPAASALVRHDPEPAGSHCPHGGAAVRAGLDRDRDQRLADTEIQTTTYACHPAPEPTLVRTDDERAGSRCPHGGTAIRAGADHDRDGRLADAEITTTTYACDDAPARAAVRRRDEPASTSCPDGGSAIDTGLDRDGDSQLDDDEVQDTIRACNAAGRAAARRRDEPTGAQCPHAGYAVDSGVDRNRNAQLDDDEVQGTIYACHDAPGRAVYRRDPEPSGRNCGSGGEAIKTGIDKNRNGRLDDDEIQATAYACAAAPLTVVIRRDDEPAGASCPHGGAAVKSGLDGNRNGRLDDAEVTATDRVCSPAPALAAVREDVEPAGVNCSHGGIAFRAGVDDDRDGSIDDAEIEHTRYACRPAPAVALFRQRAEPAGSHCATGGTAVDTGVDDDADGALDDGEVDTTTRVCAEAADEIIDGDLRIDGIISDEQRARYARVRVVAGNVIVSRAVSRAIALPALQVVRKSVFIDGVDVQLPSLVTVGDALFFDGGGASVTLPSLVTVGGQLSVDIHGHDGALSLPELTTIGGAFFSVSATNATVDAPKLTAVRGQLWFRGAMPSINLGALTTVERLTLECRSATVDLGRLETVGTVTLGRSTDISELNLPRLEHVRGAFTADAAPNLVTLSAPRLHTIGRGIVIRDLPRLTTLDLSELRFVDGEVNISRNPVLEALTLRRLSQVHGTLQLTHLPRLQSLTLDALSTIRARPEAALILQDTGLTTFALHHSQFPRAFDIEGEVEISGDQLVSIDLGSVEGLDDLHVSGPALTTLTATSLHEVTNTFWVGKTPSLTSPTLPQFMYAGELALDKTGLATVDAFANLVSVGALRVWENAQLRTLDGLRQLHAVGDLDVGLNPALTSLSGLARLTLIDGTLRLRGNPALPTLQGLHNVRRAGGIEIYNVSLVDLTGLDALRTVDGTLEISGNDRLTSLAGLGRLVDVGSLGMWENPQLPAAEIVRLRAQLGLDPQ